jgi:hypothetical protein
MSILPRPNSFRAIDLKLPTTEARFPLFTAIAISHERLAMYFDYFKVWMLSNRQTKKSDIQRPGGEHLNLIRCEDIKQGEHHFGTRLSKTTN